MTRPAVTWQVNGFEAQIQFQTHKLQRLCCYCFCCLFEVSLYLLRAHLAVMKDFWHSHTHTEKA